MPSNYPGGTDNFLEPSLPEETTLSSAGSGTRNHPEHHRDLGDAVEAIQANASKKTHNHDGANTPVGGPKLVQANTHESPDTDSATTALHHTLGVGATQAAPGNHSHGPGGPWFLCTSLTRPGSPTAGMMIYETDTKRARIWEQFPPAVSPSWRLFPLASAPVVRLRQGQTQTIADLGSIIEWHVEEEDTFGYFNSNVSLTAVTVSEPGLYGTTAVVFVGDGSAFTLTLMVNAQPTYIQQRTLGPENSPTLTLDGRVRLAAGDVVSVKVICSTVFRPGTVVDVSTKQDSRFELSYLYP